MENPAAFGDPDHYSRRFTGSDDNGGVHTNSGVPNKTAYLIVDGTVAEPGGVFNGQSFPGIGPDKTAVLYWTVMRTLTPGPGAATRAPMRVRLASAAGRLRTEIAPRLPRAGRVTRVVVDVDRFMEKAGT